MGRIKDYPKSNELTPSDVFLFDGDNGTKTIPVQDLPYSVLDPVIPVEMRKTIWRGKNLGESVTNNQYSEISAGTFKDLFLGDYWEVNGVIWRIVDFDYWYGFGDSPCRKHHLVIMPDKLNIRHRFNASNSVVGGYMNSEMAYYVQNNMYSEIISSFVSDHILHHRSFLSNGCSDDGYEISGSWYEIIVEIPCDIMILGHACAGNPITSFINEYIGEYDIDTTQLSAFRVNRKITKIEDDNYWLRDAVNNKWNSISNISGSFSPHNATDELYVRPVFGIC